MTRSGSPFEFACLINISLVTQTETNTRCEWETSVSMALYSKVNSLVQYSRVSFDLNPRLECGEFFIRFAISICACDGRAFVATSTASTSSKLFSAGDCEWRLLERVSKWIFFFFSFRDRNWVARLSLGLSWHKVAHACRLEENYVKSSLSTLLTISTSPQEEFSSSPSFSFFLPSLLMGRQANCISMWIIILDA